MISVFISYAHLDEKLKDRVLAHLSALKHEGLIDVWHDRMLKPGEHLDSKIEAELAEADLVLLLVSADFINSNYCTEKEMQHAFVRAKAGQCIVAPVILKPCMWFRIPIDNAGGRLGDFVATPRNGKPVTRWLEGRDEALTKVVTDIRGLIIDETVMRPRKSPQRQPRRPRRKARRGTRVVVTELPRAVERDVWLADAIWRLFLGTWDLPPPAERAPIGPEENQRFFDLVTKEFRQAAFDGQLPIWAKRSRDLWEAVPQEYWKDHRISYLNVIREDPTKLSIEKVGSLTRATEWREFMTNKAAVDTMAKKRR
jgi:hypothetical protein